MEDKELGMKYEYIDVPEDMVDVTEEWREKLVEAVCESDDDLLERFFEDRTSITVEEFMEATRKATIKRVIVPVFCGAAFKNKGVQRLLDGIVSLLPSPLDVGEVYGIHPHTHKEIKRKPSTEEPFSALAFKIATDPYVGRLAFLRVYSGVLEAGMSVFNTRTQGKDRINRLYQMHANKQMPIEKVEAGDICAAVGFKDIKTGDTLCDIKQPISLESMDFPDPVIGIAIEPKTQKEIDKLSIALGKLAEEDPTFRVRTDEESGQTIIRGMGELHLEVLIERLRREFSVDCNVGKPQVSYKEAITKSVQHREVFKKQTGGKGKFADIEIRISPVDEGESGLQFINSVKGGNIPKEFIPSVEKGFKEAMRNGVLASYAVDNLKVELLDGSYHPVDSDSLSFEIAAHHAFKKACKNAAPVLLEPIMAAEVVTPEEYMGDIISDFNRRRGKVEGMESKAGARVIKAKVPLAEQFGYVTALRTISSGRATSTMEFSHYEEVPSELAKEVLEKIQGKSVFV